MPVERAAGGTSLVDVLDRVLDKGIVIDAWVRVSLVGIDLITVEARVVVASIDTYLKYAEAVGQVARPRRGPRIETARTGERSPPTRDLLRAGSRCARAHGARYARRDRSGQRDADMIERGGKARTHRASAEQRRRLGLRATGLEWLGRHVTVRAGAARHGRERSRTPVGIAALGISTGAHRRVRARSERSARSARGRGVERQAGATSAPGAASPKRRSRASPFHAVPLRPDHARCRRSACCSSRATSRTLDDDIALVRGGPRREVPGAAAAQRHRGSGRRSRTAPALQHHQLGHRPDSAHRRRPAS